MLALDLTALLPQHSQNTAHRIAYALRRAILQGQLIGGQSLRQDEIAAVFQVSKIPVREALVQLQAEGLVEMPPNKGAVVTQLNTAEIHEIYAMRIALESIALRHAIPRLTNRDLANASHILTQIDQQEDMRGWAELNWEFHETLYRPSGMGRLLGIAKNLHTNVVRYLLASQQFNTPERTLSQQEHRELLEYCRQGAADAACACLERHLAGAKEAVSRKP